MLLDLKNLIVYQHISHKDKDSQSLIVKFYFYQLLTQVYNFSKEWSHHQTGYLVFRSRFILVNVYMFIDSPVNRLEWGEWSTDVDWSQLVFSAFRVPGPLKPFSSVAVHPHSTPQDGYQCYPPWHTAIRLALEVTELWNDRLLAQAGPC